MSGLGKLWYYLSDDGDLFITKLACGPRHSAAVSAVTHGIGSFARQYRNDRPFSESIWWQEVGRPQMLSFSDRTPPADSHFLWSPFMVELQVGNRGPKALMLRLGQYLQLPHNFNVLGIKIYNKQPHLSNHPFPAVAILWHKPPPHMGGGSQPKYTTVGVWNFGTIDLHPSMVLDFCAPPRLLPGVHLPPGHLPTPRPAHFQYPAPSTVITVPSANLVPTVQYSTGAMVPAGPDVTIDLAEILREATINDYGKSESRQA